jgi:putative acetyltransferase
MIRIVRTNSDNPDFAKLTSLLDEELCRIYDTKQEDYTEHNLITELPTVVLAYENQQPVGCGCFKISDLNTFELKRIFVLPSFRGNGVASKIVNELEKWGVELGKSTAILETGNKQAEAIALYAKFGYEVTEKYGVYVDMPLSVCMKKLLTQNT